MHFALALAAFMSAHAPFWSATSEEAPSVLRVYDVTAAAPIVETQQGTVIQSVHGWESDLGSRLSLPVRGREFCAEVLQNLAPDQWQMAERALSFDQEGRLVVLAPPGVQDSVAASLALFADTFGRASLLVIDVVTLKNVDAEALPALVPVAEVTRLTGAASDHRSHEIAALPGARGWLHARRTLEAVRGYEVEIAERAIGFQAQLEQTAIGLSIDCALSPAPGGSWLALNVQDVRPVGDLREVEMRLESHVSNDNSMSAARGPGRVQQVRLDELVCTLNTWLPDGKALVVRTTSDASKDTTRVLFVRQATPVTGAITRLPDNLKSAMETRDAAFLRMDAYVLPRARMHLSYSEQSLRSLAEFAGRFSDQVYGTPFIAFDSADEVIGRLQDQGELSVTTAGSWAVVVGPDRAALDAGLARVSTLLPDARAIGLKLSLKRGARAEGALAHASFAVRTGARSTIVLGRESVAARSTEVRIAQGASVTFPRMAISFEGLAVGIEPRTTPAGDLLLDLDAHARAAHGPAREFDPGASSMPILRQQDADLLDVERTVTFAKASTGPKRVVLGNAGSSTEALTLEIEVVDLR
jgi:hypothetical protein